MQEQPLLLRAEEAAKILSLGRSTIFQMLASGELPVVRIGRSVRIPRSELEIWIRARTERAEDLYDSA
ncbi:MAG: helix-turn-helix domain-containing protein [Chloroflexota bacterium]|nr:helix-turn-helix domain-containing protein [Chloroflexota bacterium]